MQSDISKLPKWAQEHIQKLTEQRETAVRLLAEFTDNQTPAPFKVTKYGYVGDSKVFKSAYIQGHSLEVCHAGIKLEIDLGKNRIDLRYDSEKGSSEIALIPRFHQGIVLVHPRGMRR